MFYPGIPALLPSHPISAADNSGHSSGFSSARGRRTISGGAHLADSTSAVDLVTSHWGSTEERVLDTFRPLSLLSQDRCTDPAKGEPMSFHLENHGLQKARGNTQAVLVNCSFKTISKLGESFRTTLKSSHGCCCPGKVGFLSGQGSTKEEPSSYC